jgi:hypothetical protein
MEMNKRYMIINDGGDIHGYDTIEETLEFFNEHIEEFNSEWVINDMESCGVSDPVNYSVIDVYFPRLSPHYIVIRDLINNLNG